MQSESGVREQICFYTPSACGGVLDLELERLKKKSNNLSVEYASKIQSLEKVIKNSLSQKDEQTDFLQRATDENKYDINELRRNICSIDAKLENNETNIYDLERNTESLEESVENSQLNIDNLNRKMDEMTGNLRRNSEIISLNLRALSKAGGDNAEVINTTNSDLITTKNDIKDKWLMTLTTFIMISIFVAIISWIADSRLRKLEMDQLPRKNAPSLQKTF